jgi:hypothetical protein
VGVESGFARAWGVGLGLDQAYQWRHVARQCALSLASLFLLEALLFGSSGFNDAPWFEAHVEAASVHATLARAPGGGGGKRGGARAMWRRTATHVTFYAGVEEAV